MKKIKLFDFNVKALGDMSNLKYIANNAKLENDVNEFLARDGKDIKVLDVKYQASESGNMIYETICVYYEDSI